VSTKPIDKYRLYHRDLKGGDRNTYSVLKDFAGSIEAARRAGMIPSIHAATASAHITDFIVRIQNSATRMSISIQPPSAELLQVNLVDNDTERNSLMPTQQIDETSLRLTI